jgi:hypothetical protein
MAVAEQKREACAATVTPARFFFLKNRIRDSLQSKVGEDVRVGRGGGSLHDRSALAGRGFGSKGFQPRRLQEEQNRRRRRQAFNFAGNRQGKCLEFLGKSLEFPCKSLEFPWNGLEKFGPVGPAAATPSSRRSWRFRAGF